MSKNKAIAVSDLRGVHKNKSENYGAFIYHNKKQQRIGTFKLACDAALAYDKAARLLKGPHWRFK